MNEIRTKLNQLRELDAHLDVIRMGKKEAINKILTDKIKAQLTEIDIEFDEISDAIKETVDTLASDIKELVLASGEGYKGDGYSASFVKGRVSWDTKALNGYAAAHPEIEQFRKIGNPSARISRKVKG